MRPFWLLTGASAVSTAGNSFLYLAVPWALIQATNSSLLAVLSIAAQTAPYLAAPFLGAFIDRYDRRLLYAAGELIQGGSIALIPVLLAFHQIPLVFVVLVVAGLAKVVSDVAGDYGLIPTLVPRHRLDQAASWFNSAQLVAKFVGPALAGLTISTVGVTWALEIDAATFLVTSLVVVAMPKQRRATKRTPLGGMVREGVSYFRSRPDLQRLTLAVALYNLGAGALEPTLLTVGVNQWHWSSAALGVAISVGAVAAAVGAWLSSRVPPGDQRRRRVGVWLGVAAVGALGLLVDTPLAVVAGFCVLCLGEGGVNAATMAYRQHAIPGELAGRVNSVIRTFIMGAIPVSALLLGLTVNLSGSTRVFVPVAVAATLAVVVWSYRANREPAPATGLVAVAEGRAA